MKGNLLTSIGLALMLTAVGTLGMAGNATADHPPVVDNSDCLADDPNGWAELCWTVVLGAHVRVVPDIEPLTVPTPSNLGEWVSVTSGTQDVTIQQCPFGQDPCTVDVTVEVPILDPTTNPQFDEIEVLPYDVERDTTTTVQPDAAAHSDNIVRDACVTAGPVCDLIENPPPPPPLPERPCQDGCSTDPCDGETTPTKCDIKVVHLADADGDGWVDGALVDYPSMDQLIYLDQEMLESDDEPLPAL